MEDREMLWKLWEVLSSDSYGMKWFSLAIVAGALIKLVAKLIPSTIRHR